MIINCKEVVRITASVPKEHHIKLEKIALKKKVSLAWVVRDSIEKYLETVNNKSR